MVDPTNQIFHVKELAYVALLAISFLCGQVKYYKEHIVFSSCIILLALISTAISTIVFLMESESTLSYYKTLLFLFVGLALSKLTIEEILKYNYLIGVCLSCYILLLYIMMITSVFDISSFIDIFRNADNTIMIAPRSVLGIPTLMFFYKTMPFVFFALAYAMRRNHYIPVIVIVLSILIGGSRTPMLMGIAIIGWIIYSKNRKASFIIGVALFIGIIYLISLFTSKQYEDGGDEIKYRTISDLISASSLLPHGVGASYWSSGRGIKVTNSEMTYFEMLYQYGGLLFPIVITLFFYPFFALFKKNNTVSVRDFGFAYLMYLINAGTNPLLINSTGIYVYSCALMIMAKVKESNKKVEEQLVSKRI